LSSGGEQLLPGRCGGRKIRRSDSKIVDTMKAAGGNVGGAVDLLKSYSGSTALSFLCDITSLTIDQVINLVVTSKASFVNKVDVLSLTETNPICVFLG